MFQKHHTPTHTPTHATHHDVTHKPAATTTTTTTTAAAAAPVTAVPHHFRYGVTLLAKDTNSASAARVAGLGVQDIRLQCHKREAVKTQGAPTDWTAMDAAVNALHAYPVHIIMTLEGFPVWDLDSCKLPKPEAVLSWGTAVINRYGDKIVGVEILNEEPSFVTGTCRAAQKYYDIASVVYPDLKALHPSLTVGGFGYTNYTGKAGTDGDPAFYFSELIKLGIQAYLDYFGLHFYNAGLPPTEAKAQGYGSLMDYVGMIKTAQASAMGSRTLPIRVTEFGNETAMAKGDCKHPIDPALQSEYSLRTFALLRAEPMVEAGYIYTCGAHLAGHVDCHDFDLQPLYAALQHYITANP